MTNATISFRGMTRDELEIAVQWAAQEGWNPGLYDADVFWRTDPNGFLALVVDGEMVGCGSIVSYDGNFGFMGFFIIRPDLRGKGLGSKLWIRRRDLLLERLAPGAAIGMDGVFAMQPFYAKGGFKFEQRNLRMQGVAIRKEYDKTRVSAISTSDLSAVLKFDREHFGFERETFLRGWLDMPESFAYKYVENGSLQGFGLIRKCQTGWKVGPLFARNFSIADELYKALACNAVGEAIFLDAPEINPDAMKLAATYELIECFGCARMYYGTAPVLPWHEIFGITSFELG